MKHYIKKQVSLFFLLLAISCTVKAGALDLNGDGFDETITGKGLFPYYYSTIDIKDGKTGFITNLYVGSNFNWMNGSLYNTDGNPGNELLFRCESPVEMRIYSYTERRLKSFGPSRNHNTTWQLITTTVEDLDNVPGVELLLRDREYLTLINYNSGIADYYFITDALPLSGNQPWEIAHAKAYDIDGNPGKDLALLYLTEDASNTRADLGVKFIIPKSKTFKDAFMPPGQAAIITDNTNEGIMDFDGVAGAEIAFNHLGSQNPQTVVKIIDYKNLSVSNYTSFGTTWKFCPLGFSNFNNQPGIDIKLWDTQTNKTYVIVHRDHDVFSSTGQCTTPVFPPPPPPGPCGSISGNHTAAAISNTTGLTYYSGTITSASAVTMSTTHHQFLATAVQFNPGFTTAISGSGQFLANAFNPTTCVTTRTAGSEGYAEEQPGQTVIVPLNPNPEKNNGIQLYPNPSTGIVYISLAGKDEQIVQVTISDITGSPVFRQNGHKTKLDLSGLVNGVYYFSIITGKTAYSGKLLKQ